MITEKYRPLLEKTEISEDQIAQPSMQNSVSPKIIQLQGGKSQIGLIKGFQL